MSRLCLLAANRLALALSFFLIALATGCGPVQTELATRSGTFDKNTTLVFEGPTMGTHYTVKIAYPRGANSPVKSPPDDAAERIQQLVDKIDGLMSTYKPDSELSRFNQSPSTEPVKASPDMIAIFLLAREVSDTTDGAFDITVGPVVNAWGFGPQKRDAPPSAEEIAGLLPRVGYKMVEIDAAASTLRKTRPDLYCDLSGIAQGYAGDKMAEMLDGLGIENYMIDISGEMRTRGLNEYGEPWQIAIERPDAPERTPQLVVSLSNISLATSGDYRNYREIDGKRLSHEIDPKTGHPIAHHLASASIIVDRCALADAYATALMVLGPEKGYALAVEKGFPAYFLVRNAAGGFDELQTPKMQEWLAAKH